jgi:hypothetical protein
MALDEPLPDREQRRQSQVPGRGDDEQRDRLEVGGVDPLHRGEKLEVTDHHHQRGGLQHRDGLVAGRRDDHPHGLGQHDPAQRLRPRHPQRPRRLRLPLVHGQQPAAHDLRHVGGLVEAEAEQAGRELVDELVGVERDELRPERDAQREPRVERGEEVPEQQLRDQRRAAEQPDVDRGDAGEHRIGRQPHDREPDAADDADRHRQHGEHERVAQAVQHWRGEEVLPDHRPAEAVVGEDRVDEHRREHG